MLTRVRDFGSTHSDAFPSKSYGADLFATVNAAVAELAEHATEQTSGSAKQSTTTKAAEQVRANHPLLGCPMTNHQSQQ